MTYKKIPVDIILKKIVKNIISVNKEKIMDAGPIDFSKLKIKKSIRYKLTVHTN